MFLNALWKPVARTREEKEGNLIRIAPVIWVKSPKALHTGEEDFIHSVLGGDSYMVHHSPGIEPQSRGWNHSPGGRTTEGRRLTSAPTDPLTTSKLQSLLIHTQEGGWKVSPKNSTTAGDCGGWDSNHKPSRTNYSAVWAKFDQDGPGRGKE